MVTELAEASTVTVQLELEPSGAVTVTWVWPAFWGITMQKASPVAWS
jgi:hypothetical protein